MNGTENTRKICTLCLPAHARAPRPYLLARAKHLQSRRGAALLQAVKA